jgi:Protein of unknown function (DUF935)
MPDETGAFQFAFDASQSGSALAGQNGQSMSLDQITAAFLELGRNNSQEPGRSITQQDYPVPHQFTYAAVWNWYQKYYYDYFDEAWIDNYSNTLAMRRDGLIQELLRHRQLPVVGLQHSFEVDDPDDPEQVSVRKQVQRVIEAIPYLQQLKLQLLEAIFYGKAGAQFVWDWKKIAGKRYATIREHIPVQGDKIAFDWDGTPGIFIYKSSDILQDPKSAPFVKNIDKGPALFLKTQSLRDRFIVHKFEPSDTDYIYETEKALSVHGLGIRDRFYWTWNMRTELLGWMLDALQRVGANGMLYAFYPTGNSQAQYAILAALKDLVQYNVAAFPRDMTSGDPSSIIQRIDPSPVGYEVIFGLVKHLEDIMRRGILGQNLTSQSAPTGLGSGVADLQAGTFEDIIKYDASCLAETLDEQLVAKVVRYNVWEFKGKQVRGDDLPFNVRMKLPVENKDIMKLMAAATSLYNMKIPFDGENYRDMTGLSAPRNSKTTVLMPDEVPPGTGTIPAAGKGGKIDKPDSGAEPDDKSPEKTPFGGNGHPEKPDGGDE